MVDTHHNTGIIPALHIFMEFYIRPTYSFSTLGKGKYNIRIGNFSPIDRTLPVRNIQTVYIFRDILGNCSADSFWHWIGLFRECWFNF